MLWNDQSIQRDFQAKISLLDFGFQDRYNRDKSIISLEEDYRVLLNICMILEREVFQECRLTHVKSQDIFEVISNLQPISYLFKIIQTYHKALFPYF